jgi:hypothetical protein
LTADDNPKDERGAEEVRITQTNGNLTLTNKYPFISEQSEHHRHSFAIGDGDRVFKKFSRSIQIRSDSCIPYALRDRALSLHLFHKSNDSDDARQERETETRGKREREREREKRKRKRDEGEKEGEREGEGTSAFPVRTH